MNSNKVDKKLLTRTFWRSMLMTGDVNPVTAMGMGYAYTMIPVYNKIYEDKEDRIDAYKRSLSFLNIATWMSGFLYGIMISMEEEASENPDFDKASINEVKTALMGPLAAIGDSLFNMIRVIITGIVAGLCASGNILGPILFLVMFNAISFSCMYFGLQYSYKVGSDLITKSKEVIDKFTQICNIVGLMAVGAMIAENLWLTTPITFGTGLGGEAAVSLQSVFDAICPQLLPLGFTWLLYYLLGKKINVVVLMIGMIVCGVILALLGIIG